MTSLILLLLITVSVTAAPSAKSSTSEESNDVDLPKRLIKRLDNTKDTDEPESLKTKPQLSQKTSRVSKKGRMHKAFFLNYPYVPQMTKYPAVSAQVDNYNDMIDERSPGHRKKYQDSEIFYIRLPPSPYFFVPGLGYISNPPKFTSTSLTPQVNHSRPQKPHHHQQQNPFINLPIDFVSNGKPTGVYQYEGPKKPLKRKDTVPLKLRKGPYAFNGRPTSIYLLGPNGEESRRQPIIYSDINRNNIY